MIFFTIEKCSLEKIENIVVDRCLSLTLIALLLQSALSAAVGHFSATLTGSRVSAASACFHISITTFLLLLLARLLVVILAIASASGACFCPYVDFTFD